ncbi:hypothetical protein ISN45_At01g031770 [Arabidopsis thaliana x Arabidopsis arenosa]|uniref:Uncharacterized protein n=1 Tax=Arabidopsis thaliana x Arabidopsis arenosa TaxID=1240361 RepID=A0A8T2GLH5_9BRAS|nr:hypothetical protein ISN45_At01g031770 [Arabidopsis thaliana x Arabidopsis arenosa]
MRTLVAPSSAIAPFDEMREVNKDNFASLGNSARQKPRLIYQEIRPTKISFLTRIANLTAFRRNEDENAHTVERASMVLKRMKDAELRVQELEVNNIDLMAKLEVGKNAYLAAVDNESQARAELKVREEKLRKLEEEQAAKIDVARKEERKKVKARFHEFSSKYGNFFRESEEVETLKVPHLFSLKLEFV